MDGKALIAFAKISAINAEVEAMKAGNDQQKAQGGLMHWTFNDFDHKARELRQIAAEIERVINPPAGERRGSE